MSGRGAQDHIPPLAPFPASNKRGSLGANVYEGYLDSWLSSIEFRLRLSDGDFAKVQFSQSTSDAEFLRSLLECASHERWALSRSQKERLLLKRAYMLLKRLLLGTDVPFDFKDSKLVSMLCLVSSVYGSIADLKTTIHSLWARDKVQMSSAIESWKRITSESLSAQPYQETVSETLRLFNPFLKVSPEAGLVLMTGSDYIESLMEAYSRSCGLPGALELPKLLTENLFYCLRSLMSDGLQNSSLLLDHLFHLKSETDRATKSNASTPTLCSSLVCQTSFLRHLAADSSVTSGKRGQSLFDALTAYRQNSAHLYPAPGPRRRKPAKGKARADIPEAMHIHKASQVSQVHELFPNLSNNYILRLLDHFNDDPEAVIAALLEPDSLPPSLRESNGSETLSISFDGPAHDLAPRPTPPLLPQRKSVFDGDDFDRLQISAQRLHKGRKEIKIEEDGGDEHVRRKAAIMAALAAFDSDDDERDDSYDVADVGGTVDSTVDTDSRSKPEHQLDQNLHEESLFRAWKDNEELFARDSKTRASTIRQDLKRQTGMSDEQLEGWAIMLKKNQKLQDRLEHKYSALGTFRGNQTELAATRWQDDTAEESEEAGSSNPDGRIGQARSRGRGRAHGRGGSTAGPSGDASTQAARKRKEQGRGRGGANHGRREGRTRKIGRGMAGPAS
ncbi:hypothetical protein PV08_07834 [Exophiala spinifera]|uniref:CUE domain-containing protein n=1 Tax=Exophiala spinifera TaxID=91928 RepID=A0A0D1ZQK1_9EURO|nr:uncharacterized protein PV08_07834 [Exophiala spinifera]KIW15047.1 hypothetical protein PV08_07834 [Exophiala spinifera]